MPDSDPPLKEATEIVQEHGCPICGETPAFHYYNGGAEISLSPCGHAVSPGDYRVQEHLKHKVQEDQDG